MTPEQFADMARAFNALQEIVHQAFAPLVRELHRIAVMRPDDPCDHHPRAIARRKVRRVVR